MNTGKYIIIKNQRKNGAIMKIDVTYIESNKVKKESHNCSDTISISELEKRIKNIISTKIMDRGNLCGTVKVTTENRIFTLTATRELSGSYLIDTKTTEREPVTKL